jgi:capsular polysaccharide transport system permease protein
MTGWLPPDDLACPHASPPITPDLHLIGRTPLESNLPTLALPTAAALPPQAPAAPRFKRALRRLLRRTDGLFVVTVLLPTLLAAIYYGLVASDVYISESRFVVRNPQRATQATGLGALLQGSGFTRSQDDTYSVHDFARSRDALHELDNKLQLRKAYANPAIDVVGRFPGLDWDDSFEALHRYYQKHVTIDYDTTSSISVLSVRAYSAGDARAINDLLLQMSERLVNNLNNRSRQDLISVAEGEVLGAENKAKAAALALSAYRADRAVFDPNAQSALQLQGVAKLQEELLASESQLAQIRLVAPSNPQIAPLVNRVEGLRKAMAAETGKVIGIGASLTAKAPVYDRLQLEKTFADRQLGSALASLETARSDASRKQLYLERLVQPNLPDMAMEPRRLRSVLMVLVLGLICWGVLSLVLASIKEHTD